jgi:tetratricopeptide (TPR) repeat protein
MGNYTGAIADYEKLISFDSSNKAVIHFALGNSFFMRQDYDSAISSYTKAMALEDNIDCCLNRGLSYLSKGDYDSAQTDFSHVLKMDANNETALELITIAEQEKQKRRK